MPTPQQLRSRLLKKLKELLQLDQPDLDFGFYRIMHAKSVQVQEFIEKDLLKIVADAFGQVDEARASGLRADYEKAIEIARKLGAPEPEKAPKVQEFMKRMWDVEGV
jgi:adenine-specific DNA-methyltransferase